MYDSVKYQSKAEITINPDDKQMFNDLLDTFSPTTDNFDDNIDDFLMFSLAIKQTMIQLQKDLYDEWKQDEIRLWNLFKQDTCEDLGIAHYPQVLVDEVFNYLVTNESDYSDIYYQLCDLLPTLKLAVQFGKGEIGF